MIKGDVAGLIASVTREKSLTSPETSAGCKKNVRKKLID